MSYKGNLTSGSKVLVKPREYTFESFVKQTKNSRFNFLLFRLYYVFFKLCHVWSEIRILFCFQHEMKAGIINVAWKQRSPSHLSEVAGSFFTSWSKGSLGGLVNSLPAQEEYFKPIMHMQFNQVKFFYSEDIQILYLLASCSTYIILQGAAKTADGIFDLWMTTFIKEVTTAAGPTWLTAVDLWVYTPYISHF